MQAGAFWPLLPLDCPYQKQYAQLYVHIRSACLCCASSYRINSLGIIEAHEALTKKTSLKTCVRGRSPMPRYIKLCGDLFGITLMKFVLISLLNVFM